MGNKQQIYFKSETTVTDTPQKEILWAAENGDVKLVQQLLAKDLNLMKVTDNDGYTPLHRAAYNNHLNVLNVSLCQIKAMISLFLEVIVLLSMI